MDTHLPITSRSGELESERLQQARVYARIKRRLMLVSLAINLAGVLLLLSGLGIWLRNLLHQFAWLSWQPVTDWYPGQILAYFLVLWLVYELVTAPLSYISGYLLPHRYHLSTLSLGAWISDRVKGLALSVLLEAVIIEMIYALLALQPTTWWLWAGLILVFFSVIMVHLTPVLLLPLFYTFTPLPEGEITRRLLSLTTQAHTRVRGVFKMHLSEKTTTANAALMGLGNTRRIVVGDTMLDRYPLEEIEVVLAHELGHHVHRDLWKLLLSQSALILIGLFLVNLAFHWAVNSGHIYPGLADSATLPFLFALTGIFGLLIMPLSNGLSRAVEYQADEYALQATRKVEAFKSAMERLANQNLAEVEPSPIVEWLFYDHPSIYKRLQHAKAFAERMKAEELAHR